MPGTTELERIAVLEQIARDYVSLYEDILREYRALEKRVNSLERTTDGLATSQRDMDRATDRRVQKLSLATQWGGLAVGIGMLVLSAVTLYVH